MLKNAVFVTALFLVMNSSFAESGNALAKNFIEAQQLSAQGKTSQAIAAYQSIVRTNPLLPEAYNNLAALYLKQKKVKQAKHILEQGLHAHKGYGVLYDSLTAINVAMAREAYSKALQIELKPSNIEIASLSLSKNPPLSKNPQGQKKTAIVISKIKEPVAAKTKKTVEKAASPAGEVRRNTVTEKSEQAQISEQKRYRAIEKTLQAWSVAWTAQAADMYLSFYHDQYKPVNGMSRKGWAQSRRYRLKKPSWIKIGLSNIKVVRHSVKQATVVFKQAYQSNSFRDVSHKQMVMLYTDEGWRIFREKNI